MRLWNMWQAKHWRSMSCLPLPSGSKLLALIAGEVAPADHSRLQREIGGGFLRGGEFHARLRIRFVADGANAQVVISGGKIFDAIAAVGRGQHIDRDLRRANSALRQMRL